MQVRARRDTRVAAESNPLALLHVVTDFHQYFGQMGIPGLSAVLMVNIYHIAVTAAPACLGYPAAAGSHNGGAHRGGPILALVVSAGPLGRRFPSAESRG